MHMHMRIHMRMRMRDVQRHTCTQTQPHARLDDTPLFLDGLLDGALVHACIHTHTHTHTHTHITQHTATDADACTQVVAMHTTHRPMTM